MVLDTYRCESCYSRITINTKILVTYVDLFYYQYYITCGMCGHYKEFTGQLR